MKKVLTVLLIVLVCMSAVFASGASDSSASGKHKIGILAPAVTHG